MNECSKCLLIEAHPFGIYFNQGVCSGCLGFEVRQKHLPAWTDLDLDRLKLDFKQTTRHLPERVIVPFDADGETWFVLDTLLALGIRPVVVYFNAQYHDTVFFSLLSACQENFDADFIGFSLPRDTIRFAISEEFSVGHGHCRNLEIFGRHAAALYAADHLGIEHIISGPHQQSEVVGSHSFIVKNQLKRPAFNDIVIGKDLLPQVRHAISNVGSKFSQTFNTGVTEHLLERIQWHYLSDYVFWDSESINKHYGAKLGVRPRNVNGYGPSWQSSSSSLKLEFFDLLRLISTGHSKIESYLSRDIRFGRMRKPEALRFRSQYMQKPWDIEGIAQFLDITHTSVQKAIELYQKKTLPMYQPLSLAGKQTVAMFSHNQSLR